MHIGILGAGNIGGTLGAKLAVQGHNITFGVRDPNSAKAELSAQRAAQVKFASPKAAADSAELLIVALPLNAAQAVLSDLGDLSDKIIVDTTNAFGGLPAGYTSAAQAVAAWAKSARVVKAFNAGPWESLDNPVYQGLHVETFVCGDDAESKRIVMQLAREIGLSPVDVGGLANAALTENLARLWGALAMQMGMGRNIAFKLVQR